MKNWTYNEFLAFCMLYAASADMTISEEEEALIKEKLNEKQYQSIKAIFDKSSDAAIIDIILSYHDQYFNTEEQRERLLSEMRKVLDADHQYSIMERNLMKLFKHLI